MSLKQRIKIYEDFLGPRVDYDSDYKKIKDIFDKWMLIELMKMKDEYFKKV